MDQATHDEIYCPLLHWTEFREETYAETQKAIDEAPKKRETAHFIDGIQVNVHFIGEVALTIYNCYEMADKYNRPFTEREVVDSIRISAYSVDEVLKAAKAGIDYHNLANNDDFDGMMIVEEYTGQYNENILNDIFK